jgi:hypothetical protein
MRVPLAVLGCVLAAVLTGCGGGDDAATDGATRTPSSTPSATEPSEQASDPATTKPTPDGPEDGIPDAMLLPRQGEGRAEPDSDQGRLYDHICLDPRQQWTLGTGFVEARTVVFRRPVVVEKLAVYPSTARASRAFEGLLEQVDLCGDGTDHVGHPMTWRAEGLAGLGAADEAARLTYRSEGEIGTVVTVARLGRAVFYVDRRAEHDAGVGEDEQTVADFLPELGTAFD